MGLIRLALETVSPSRNRLAFEVASLLAKVYAAPPTAESLKALANQAPCPADADPISDLAAAVRHEASVCDAAEANREYVRLFLNPSGALCPPWETLWREEEDHQFMGSVHQYVLGCFRRIGLLPRHADNEPADHISTGFALVAELTGRLEADPIYRDLLTEFWNSHLLNWVPAFAVWMLREARLPLYTAVARLTIAAVATE